MKKKLFFIPLFAIAVIGIILGSFLDLSINTAIYDRYNGFGLFMAAFGEAPVYAFMGVLAYGMIYLCRHYKLWWQRTILIFIAVAAIGVGLYYQGEHVFSVNAYNDKSKLFIGFIIAAGLIGLGALGGHFLFSKTDVEPKQILKVLISIIIIMGFSVLVTQVVKSIMARPRFRFLSDYNIVNEFRNWWERGSDLKKEFVGTIEGVTSEEFKSFPSGHLSNTAAIIAMCAYLPLLNNHIKVKQEILYFAGIIWCLLLAYSRMRVGAHFLSDVSFGLLIASIGFFVVDLILFKNKKEETVTEG